MVLTLWTPSPFWRASHQPHLRLQSPLPPYPAGTHCRASWNGLNYSWVQCLMGAGTFQWCNCLSFFYAPVSDPKKPITSPTGTGMEPFLWSSHSGWIGTSFCLPRKSSLFPFHHCYSPVTAVAATHTFPECEVYQLIFVVTFNNLKSPGDMTWNTVSSDCMMRIVCGDYFD